MQPTAASIAVVEVRPASELFPSPAAHARIALGLATGSLAILGLYLVLGFVWVLTDLDKGVATAIVEGFIRAGWLAWVPAFLMVPMSFVAMVARSDARGTAPRTLLWARQLGITGLVLGLIGFALPFATHGMLLLYSRVFPG